VDVFDGAWRFGLSPCCRFRNERAIPDRNVRTLAGVDDTVGFSGGDRVACVNRRTTFIWDQA
jgi:hypothetical protein